jgi:hypothetical protein
MQPSNAATADWTVICSRLKIPDRDVSNVYLLGSRLWGTSGPDSDWDFLIIVDDKSSALASAPKMFVNIHVGNFDAMIMAQSLYVEKLQNLSSTYELLSVWLPRECTESARYLMWFCYLFQ